MQKSAHNLSSTQEKSLFDQLITVLTDINKPTVMKTFLETFFSETELSVFAKRLAILVSLDEGKSYEEISQELKVSSATISAVAGSKDLPVMKQVLVLLKRDKKISQFLGIL